MNFRTPRIAFEEFFYIEVPNLPKVFYYHKNEKEINDFISFFKKYFGWNKIIPNFANIITRLFVN